MFKKQYQCRLAAAVGTFLVVCISSGCKPETPPPSASSKSVEPPSASHTSRADVPTNKQSQESPARPEPTPADPIVTSVPSVIEVQAEHPLELVRNGSYEYWNEKGWPAQWSVKTGQIEKSADAVAGESAVKLAASEEGGNASLRTELTIPEGSGGKILKLTLQAKAPEESLKVFIGTDKSQIGRLRAQTNPDSYTSGILRLSLPEDVGPELWLLVSADLGKDEVAVLDEISLLLLPAK